MKKSLAWALILTSFLTTLEAPISFAASKNYWQEGEYSVYEVVDGDTFKVRMKGKIESVRVLGLDTPEKYTTRTGYEECYGKEASDKAWNLLHRKTVRLVSDKTQGYRDRYQRILAHAYLPDGALFSAKMIEEGYGFRYVYGKKVTKEDALLLKSEKNAKSANVGVWKVCDGVRKSVNAIVSSPSTINSNSSWTIPVQQNSIFSRIFSSSIFDIPRSTSVPSFPLVCSSQKRFCRHMNSCEEAKYHLLSCKVQTLDSDGDGVPCESICKE